MTLFSLARKNIARNLSQYFLYIASMVFSIIIYFTFVTLKYSDTDSAEQTASSQKLGSLMSGAAVILIFFVAIFIAYSNSFFMKKRKKKWHYTHCLAYVIVK